MWLYRPLITEWRTKREYSAFRMFSWHGVFLKTLWWCVTLVWLVLSFCNMIILLLLYCFVLHNWNGATPLHVQPQYKETHTFSCWAPPALWLEGRRGWWWRWERRSSRRGRFDILLGQTLWLLKCYYIISVLLEYSWLREMSLDRSVCLTFGHIEVQSVRPRAVASQWRSSHSDRVVSWTEVGETNATLGLIRLSRHAFMLLRLTKKTHKGSPLTDWIVHNGHWV